MKETVEITRKGPKRQDIMAAIRVGVYTVGGGGLRLRRERYRIFVMETGVQPQVGKSSLGSQVGSLAFVICALITFGWIIDVFQVSAFILALLLIPRDLDETVKDSACIVVIVIFSFVLYVMATFLNWEKLPDSIALIDIVIIVVSFWFIAKAFRDDTKNCRLWPSLSLQWASYPA